MLAMGKLHCELFFYIVLNSLFLRALNDILIIFALTHVVNTVSMISTIQSAPVRRIIIIFQNFILTFAILLLIAPKVTMVVYFTPSAQVKNIRK